MAVQNKEIIYTTERKGNLNPKKLLILIVFIVLVLSFLGLIIYYVFLDYRGSGGNKDFGSYLKDEYLKNSGGDCLYEMSNGLVEFPFRLEADIEIIDSDTILVRNPKGCKNKFEFVAAIGDFRRPVTKVYTFSGTVPPDEEKILNKGFPNDTPYYIGDKNAYKNGSLEAHVVDKGKLSKLYEDSKEYSKKNALLLFYLNERVYFNEDKVYVTEVFLNEK